MNREKVLAKALKTLGEALIALSDCYDNEENGVVIMTEAEIEADRKDTERIRKDMEKLDEVKTKRETKKAKEEPVEVEEEEPVEAVEVEEVVAETEELNLSDLELEDLQLIAKQMKLRGYRNLETPELLAKLEGSDQSKLMLALEELGYLEEGDVVEVKEDIIREQKKERGETLPEVPELPEEDPEEVVEEDETSLEELDEDTLKAICTELGISTRGKKQALITRIYTVDEEQIMQALETLGLTSAEDEDEPEEEEEEVVEEPKKSKSKGRVTMSPKRAETIKDIPDSVDEELKSKSLTFDEIYDVLEDLGRITEGEDDSDKVLKEKYIQLVTDLVDDNGEVLELEQPYFVNDKLRCCGEEVTIEGTEGTCSHCKNTYALED